MSSIPETPGGERFIPGSVIAGRYRVVELVGRGGMGEVYRALDLKLGQPVALKFLSQDVGEDPERLHALFDEVRLARQVSHPNVCRVHDIEEMDGTHFLSMEFVDGEDLASLLRRIGHLPADKAVEITREICSGLTAIHDRGVLHRDLKPANVMVDGRGHARITDFGLALPQGGATDPDLITGTPDYMSPESLSGEPAGVRSDLYSLGLVTYELFTGHRAFEAASLREMIRQRRESTPIPLSRHVRDIDPQLERAILSCLDPEPSRRPESASAFATSLPGADPLSAAISAGETPSPELLVAPTRRSEALRPWVAWTCLGALAAGLMVLLLVAPRTRLVPALGLSEPPDAMAVHARDILHGLGIPNVGLDHAIGFDDDASALDGIAEADRSPSRWRSLATLRPPVATFWYRDSPGDLVGAAPWHRVTYDDPPWSAGMAGIKLDARGRLQRLDAPPTAESTSTADSALAVGPLFDAAGLNRADFHPTSSTTTPIAAGDQRLVFQGHDRGDAAHVLRAEVVAFRGRAVAFEIQDPRARPVDLTRATTSRVVAAMRPALFLAALLFGAWLARRNLWAGRGDTKRALRVALAMACLRVLVWILGAHHTYGSLTTELMTTVAWTLYDFAYGWVFYIAIEPYARRLWPRLLISWARLVDGKLSDVRVGRDLLIGCLMGTVVALLVAAHQSAPLLFGEPPGRPDNVGFVENQLNSLLGIRHQLAELFSLVRSNILLVMSFGLILLIARVTLRNALAAGVVSFLIFVPLALPKGEIPALDVGLALAASALLVFVMLRFGLLAVGVAVVTHAALESAPLGMPLGSWAASREWFVLGLVFGLGFYGFTRAIGRSRPAKQGELRTAPGAA